MHWILLSCLGWCPYLLLGIVGLTTKTDMQNCWSFICCSLELLAHHENVASLCLFDRYYFDRCSSELAQLVPLLYYRGMSTRYSDRLHDFSVTIPKCYRDVYVNSFFHSTARFWNSLAIECFPLAYDLNCFKSRINMNEINSIVGFCLIDFLYALIFLCFFFL